MYCTILVVKLTFYHLNNNVNKQNWSKRRYPTLILSDSDSRPNFTSHGVDVSKTTPIKQHPYQINPLKSKEIQYMLDNDIIEPGQSNWSSLCILVPKPDGSFRFCADYRKENAVANSDVCKHVIVLI